VTGIYRKAFSGLQSLLARVADRPSGYALLGARPKGGKLVALTADTATIETLTGCRQAYRRPPVDVGRSIADANGPPLIPNIAVKFNESIVRGGINYRFSFRHALERVIAALLSDPSAGRPRWRGR
jgi:hypothetical protein